MEDSGTNIAARFTLSLGHLGPTKLIFLWKLLKKIQA